MRPGAMSETSHDLPSPPDGAAPRDSRAGPGLRVQAVVRAPEGTPWVPAAIACLTLAIHFATNGRYGYFRDELYYIACGHHLAWGYVEHTPLIAVVAAVARSLFGDSLFGARFFPALAHAGLVLCTGVTARALGGGRFAQGLAALAVLTAPVYLASSTILNMNPFDQLSWSLCSLILITLMMREQSQAWLLFGAVAGVGLMNKHSMVLFLVATLMAMLLTRERRWLLTPWPWLGGVIAAAIDLLGPKYGLPGAVSGHNNYYLWGPPSAERSVVITVGESTEDVGTLCGEVEEAAVFRHGYNMAFEVMRQSAGTIVCPTCGILSDLPILVGRHFKHSWQMTWPCRKKYL